MSTLQVQTPLSAFSAILLGATIVTTVLLSGSVGGSTVNFVVTALFVCVATATIFVEKKTFRLFPEFLILAIWLLYSLLPSIGADRISLALNRIEQMFQILVLALISLNVMIWHGRTAIFASLFFTSAIASYIASLAGFGFGVIDVDVLQELNSDDRIVGTTGNANQFGMLCLLAQLAAVFFATQVKRTYARLAAGLAIVVLAAAIINTGSRTALIGMVFSMGGLVWVFKVWRIRLMARALLMLAVLGVTATGTFLALQQNDEIRARIDSYLANEYLMSRYDVLARPFRGENDDLVSVDAVIDGSTIERARLIDAAWNAALSNPLGLGLDNLKVITNDYAHSNYMELLATTGFPGIAFYVAIYLCMLRRPLALARDRGELTVMMRLFVISILTLMLTDIANVSYYDKANWLFITLAIASIHVCRETALDRPKISPETRILAHGAP